jgi:S-phase kinase-associated protein 1
MDEIIKVQTCDGQVFDVLKARAETSTTLKNLIADAPAGGDVPLPEVNGDIFQRVIAWVEMHKDDPVTAVPLTENGLTVADKEFFAAIDQQSLFQLILAANYLDIRKLLDMCCRTVADSVLGKTPKEIYAQFGVAQELTPEEEAEIRKDNPWLDDTAEK